VTSFPAFTVSASPESGWVRSVTEMTLDELMPGDVVVKVEASGINYKDGLASTEAGKIARINPLVPGVDAAGIVTESSSAHIAVGTRVIVHGYGLGVAHHGGYAGYIRVPAEWVVPMPATLTSQQAMMIGTAGYTSALSVAALEHAGLRAEHGPVVVTGATGGVGSIAVSMLARRGYTVVASSGKPADDYLKGLGASEVIHRDELAATSTRPIDKERWAGAVDCVGGTTLASVIRGLKYGASVAASGLTGGGDLPTTVFPFILRGVNLLGIDSVNTPLADRIAVWHRIAGDLRPMVIDEEPKPENMVGLGGLAVELDRILAGGMTGRMLVNPWA
jgi:acrylyl-CoA reductase (NADPH)